MLIWGREFIVDLEQVLSDVKAEALSKRRTFLTDTRRSGHDIFVTCPKHENHGGIEERTPSCSIHKDYGTVHCFGCGYTDSLPGMIARILNLEDALKGYRWLLRHYTVPDQESRTVRPLKEIARREAHVVLPDEALKPYMYDHPYMFKRGLTTRAIDLYELGYDQQTKSITIPMRDQKNALRFIKRRPIGNTTFGKYHIDEGLDKKDLLYGSNILLKYRDKINMLNLTEGEFDAISFIETYDQDHKDLGLGLQGSILFPGQLKVLVRYAKGMPICVFTDNDKTGCSAREKIIPMLKPYFPVFVPRYPVGYKDPNDLLKAGLLQSVRKVRV